MKETIEEKVKKEVALQMIKFKIDFLVKHYNKTLPDIEQEIKDIHESDGWSNAINYEAGTYKSVATGLFKDIKEVQEKLKKIFKYE